ncbi:MAG: porin family protein [Paludibacter sp.]
MKLYNLLVIVVITFGILFSSMAFGQRKYYATEKYWGINGGVTGSMVGFKPSVSQSFLLGYNGGLVFRYINAKSLGFQTELNYSQRGWTEKDGLFSKQLNYIELPILTHFNFGNNFRAFFNIGPKLSYLISEKTLVNNTVNSTQEQHIKATEHPFEYSLVVGTGFYIRLKKQVFQVEARANYGAVDLYSNAASDYFDASNNINASLNFSWLLQTK